MKGEYDRRLFRNQARLDHLAGYKNLSDVITRTQFEDRCRSREYDYERRLYAQHEQSLQARLAVAEETMRARARGMGLGAILCERARTE